MYVVRNNMSKICSWFGMRSDIQGAIQNRDRWIKTIDYTTYFQLSQTESYDSVTVASEI